MMHSYRAVVFLILFLTFGFSSLSPCVAQQDMLLLGVLEDTPVYLIGLAEPQSEGHTKLHLRLCLPEDASLIVILDSLATPKKVAANVASEWQADFIRRYLLEATHTQIDLPLPLQAQKSNDETVAFQQEWLEVTASACTANFIERFAATNPNKYRYSIQKIHLERGYVMSFPSAEALRKAALGDKPLKIGKNYFDFVPYIHAAYEPEDYYPIFLISKWK
ncbi:MAG: hypothetical protein JJT94_13635 [Bernardetiaceae bacterium]|nr:hypothetical protein [Bernardetiaceae bacterium]